MYQQFTLPKLYKHFTPADRPSVADKKEHLDV